MSGSGDELDVLRARLAALRSDTDEAATAEMSADLARIRADLRKLADEVDESRSDLGPALGAA